MTAATSPDRLGPLGERVAARHLSELGYRILARNFRTRYGELDLVAQNDACLVFCEVKTRLGTPAAGLFPPLLSVGADKQRRVRAMARQWLAADPPRDGPSDLRFDAIGVTVDAHGRVLALDHVEDAFW